MSSSRIHFLLTGIGLRDIVLFIQCPIVYLGSFVPRVGPLWVSLGRTVGLAGPFLDAFDRFRPPLGVFLAYIG